MLLLVNRLDLWEPVDIFASIRDEIAAPEKLMILNDSQMIKAVTEFAPVALFGVLLCHGPPGSGKTYFISQLVKALLSHSCKKKVLLVLDG
jgi:predicted AAA+ superfamily ATPase